MLRAWYEQFELETGPMPVDLLSVTNLGRDRFVYLIQDKSMSAVILDGHALASGIRAAVRERAGAVTRQIGRAPGLAVVLVGEDPASRVYVASKSKAARECGIEPLDFRLPADSSQDALEALLGDLSAREDVDGILLQLPLPKGLDELRALTAIHPSKDADGLTAANQGLLLRDAPCFEPCTPKGCIRLIDHARELLRLSSDLAGLRAIVIGRSVLVGKPVGMMLLKRNCTVQFAHSKTRQLEEECRRADIVIAAVGRPGLVRGEWLSPESIVIDVGINRLPNGKLTGDVDFEGAVGACAALTPVPKGVGPMTIAMLLENTVISAENRARHS